MSNDDEHPKAADRGPGRPTRIIKPTPGGRAPSGERRPAGQEKRRPYSSEPPNGPEPQLSNMPNCVGINPLEAAASTLLDVLARLRNMPVHPDPRQLHQSLVLELKAFEKQARTARIDPEDIFVARYVLCTALDDAVLNTEWGNRSGWPQEPLLYLFHKEKKGGVRFFEILETLLQDPRKHLHLLQIMFLCLLLGYQGRYRQEPRGAAELAARRERVFREIRRDDPRELSPQWKGVPRRRRNIRRYLALWTLVTVVSVGVASLYSYLGVRINNISDPVYDKLLTIKGPVSEAKADEETDAETLIPDQERIQTLLNEDLTSGIVELDNSAVDSRFVLATSVNGGLFQSGRSDVKPTYLALINRVGDALATTGGKILVIGHTDNVPPKRGFPSNFELSLARAQAVQDLLQARTGSPERFLPAEGRGASEPMVKNDTAANRALNRRVEVKLLLYADD